MIDEVDSEMFTLDAFVREYVIPGKPLLFRNFFSTQAVTQSQLIPSDSDRNYDTFETGAQCSTDSFLQLVQSTNLTCKVYGCYRTNTENRKVRCSNTFLSQLIRHPDLIVQQHMRMWKHTSGHYTRVHYDANNINVFNFSLSGEKKFFLSPPRSRAVFPMTNIGILPHMSSHTVSVVTLRPGELLYIPSCWFHAVLTVKESININMGFFHKDAAKLINKRDNDLIYINRALNTYFYKTHRKYLDPIYTCLPLSSFKTLAKEIGLLVSIVVTYTGMAPLNGVVHSGVRIILGLLVPWHILSTTKNHGGIMVVHAYALTISVLTGSGMCYLRERKRTPQ
jgi:hypothetical protein